MKDLQPKFPIVSIYRAVRLAILQIINWIQRFFSQSLSFLWNFLKLTESREWLRYYLSLIRFGTHKIEIWGKMVSLEVIASHATKFSLHGHKRYFICIATSIRKNLYFSIFPFSYNYVWYFDTPFLPLCSLLTFFNLLPNSHLVT